MKKGFVIPLLITIVAILAVGGGVFYYLNKPIKLDYYVYPVATTTPIVGGDRDAHGCIGSAGYSWCAIKNKCLRVWEEKCEITTVSTTTKPVACTMDAKQCPDGSWVGRSGSNCEFVCPTVSEIKNYKTYTNTEYGFEFQYPISWKMVKEYQASSIDYLPFHNFVAIFPTNYPAQDFSGRIDIYKESLTIVKKDNPFIKNFISTPVIINGISWTKMGNSDYLVENNGMTYHISGSPDLSEQIVKTFKFTN